MSLKDSEKKGEKGTGIFPMPFSPTKRCLSPLFAAYGNYVYGAYWGSAGASLGYALDMANTVGSLASYSPYTLMSSTYPGLPVGNVQAITQGFNDAQNGVLWSSSDW